MTVKVLIVEDNPVARQFLTRVVRESFSDVSGIGEAGDLESARRALGVGGMPPPPGPTASRTSWCWSTWSFPTATGSTCSRT